MRAVGGSCQEKEDGEGDDAGVVDDDDYDYYYSHEFEHDVRSPKALQL